MENKNITKGILLVGLGASAYGMLATFVKLAYKEGFTTAEVTTAQFSIGLIGLLIINFINRKKIKKIKKGDLPKLIIFGSSMGFTSLFYYLAVQYINVSIGIVLLMQSVWISIVIESFIEKTFPSARKIFATIIILGGTLLATNIFNQSLDVDLRGIFWGFLAACSFSTTMFVSNRIATYLPNTQKSLYMLYGGGIVVVLFLFFSQLGPHYFDGLKSFYNLFSSNTEGVREFDGSIFIKYGLLLSLFGTILPPLLLTAGFPHTGLGLGSIVSSLELPVSVLFAFFLLHEKVELIQWFGILLILSAVVYMNANAIQFKKKTV